MDRFSSTIRKGVSLEKALELAQAAVIPITTEDCDLLQAVGRVY